MNEINLSPKHASALSALADEIQKEYPTKKGKRRVFSEEMKKRIVRVVKSLPAGTPKAVSARILGVHESRIRHWTKGTAMGRLGGHQAPVEKPTGKEYPVNKPPVNAFGVKEYTDVQMNLLLALNNKGSVRVRALSAAIGILSTAMKEDLG